MRREPPIFSYPPFYGGEISSIAHKYLMCPMVRHSHPPLPPLYFLSVVVYLNPVGPFEYMTRRPPFHHPAISTAWTSTHLIYSTVRLACRDPFQHLRSKSVAVTPRPTCVRISNIVGTWGHEDFWVSLSTDFPISSLVHGTDTWAVGRNQIVLYFSSVSFGLMLCLSGIRISSQSATR